LYHRLWSLKALKEVLSLVGLEHDLLGLAGLHGGQQDLLEAC